jgi:hypothetical protein
MKLRHLFDMEMVYDGQPPFHVWKPWGTEGFGYGAGSGSVGNGALTGKLTWYNFPRWRSDGAFLPDCNGVIDLDGTNKVLFTFQGFSVEASQQPAAPAAGQPDGYAWMNKSGGSRRAVTVSMTFQTADERHLYLNTTLGVAEGAIDLRSLSMQVRVYGCVNEIVDE